MSRPSTSAYVSFAVVSLIHRYIRTTGQGVIVRHRGTEYAVDYVAGITGTVDKHARFACFPAGQDGLEMLVPKECTIPKATLAQLELELDLHTLVCKLTNRTAPDTRLRGLACLVIDKVRRSTNLFSNSRNLKA